MNSFVGYYHHQYHHQNHDGFSYTSQLLCYCQKAQKNVKDCLRGGGGAIPCTTNSQKGDLQLDK